ncbi:MAG: hypothetical protein AAFO95_12230 [Cyanobacteria bacterium J06600_6]
MGDKDFFLSPDDAMTMGDIEYMRTSKRTRRTFPKTLSNKEGFAIENEVSSVRDNNNKAPKVNKNEQNAAANTFLNTTPSTMSQPSMTGGSAVPQAQPVQASESAPAAPAAPAPQTFDAPKPSAEKRRPADDSMDMFRNMAKNIKRR